MNRELENALDSLDGAIELIRLFAGNLAITEDYKMNHYSDEGGWEELDIDASEISKDLLELVETVHDKYIELSRMIDNVSNVEQEHKEG